MAGTRPIKRSGKVETSEHTIWEKMDGSSEIRLRHDIDTLTCCAGVRTIGFLLNYFRCENPRMLGRHPDGSCKPGRETIYPGQGKTVR